MISKIIDFLRGDAVNYKGKTLIQLQSMTDFQLERSHDVVQWMFPTDIASKNNQDAPVLSVEDIEIIKIDSVIKDAILLSLTRMIWFYEHNDFWITQKNHNFLRLSRILRCLWLAELKHDYVSLQKALDEVFIDNSFVIGEETYLYWKNANNEIFIKDSVKRESLLLSHQVSKPIKEKENSFNSIAAFVEFGHQFPKNAQLTDMEMEAINNCGYI